MDIDSLREEIDNSIASVQRLGWTIRAGMWVSPRDKCCCPLGAIVVDEFGPDAKNRFYSCDTLVPEMLGLDREETYSFADGFDFQGYDNKKHVFKFWNLGREYGIKYRKIYNENEQSPPTIPEFE